MSGPDGAQEGSMTDQPGEPTPPAKTAAKKTAAKKTAARRAARKAATPREKQVAVRLTRKTRGYAVGDTLNADESRAAELVQSGVAVYVE